jgi:DNA replication protein DnaC
MSPAKSPPAKSPVTAPQRDALDGAAIREHCKQLRLPTVAAQCDAFAQEAVRARQSHLRFLDALLWAELEERERTTVERRLKEAHLPRLKTLEEFDFAKAPHVSATQVLHLSQGGYLDKSEPVLFIGDSGTGKTHLATGLCVAACRQKRRVRFATAAGLVNELVEAQHFNQLGRALSRWSRYDLICIDEVGYVPLAELGAEFLFQVISERAERAAVLITTNLPFSEWTQVFTNARLCKALLDRLTDRAHIIETGTDSYRFRRTLESRRAGRAGASKSPALPASSAGPQEPSNHVESGAKTE